MKLKHILESVLYDKFPQNALVKVVKQFKSFNEFNKAFTVDINHGYYWHVTSNPKFEISDKITPSDKGGVSDTIDDPGALMITSDLENWDYHYNGDDDTDDGYSSEPTRPYAALIDASDLPQIALKQVSRGHGNEVYVKPQYVKQLKIIDVYPIEQARRLDKKYHNMIPQSEEELLYLWKHANKK